MTSNHQTSINAEIIRSAVSERRPLKSKYALLRLFDGQGDGIPELTLDLYGDLLLAHLTFTDSTSVRAIELALRDITVHLADEWALKAFYLRIHDKNPRSTANRDAQLLHGERILSGTVQEHGLNYIVKPEKNVNAGLFLDTRDLRKNLIAQSGGAKVMNCFCFTGSLGLAALAGGADEVVQLDISKSILSWAKENREANPDVSGNMRFICEDCRAFMERERRRVQSGSRTYDSIIIDPPAFGTTAGKKFVYAEDVPGLVDLAMEVLSDSGELILCGNVSHIGTDELERLVLELAGKRKRKVVSVREVLPPAEDFRANRSSVRGVWVKFQR